MLPWVKIKQGSKTVYTAPAEAYPMVAVIYTPSAVNKWTVEYANFGPDSVTQAQVEKLMGL